MLQVRGCAEAAVLCERVECLGDQWFLVGDIVDGLATAIEYVVQPLVEVVVGDEQAEPGHLDAFEFDAIDVA